MWTRAQLKENAKEKLKRYYWGGFVVTLIFSLIGGGGGGFTSGYNAGLTSMETESVFEYSNEISLTLILIMLIVVMLGLVLGTAFVAFLVNPLSVGVKRYFLMSGVQKTEVSEILYAFKKGAYLNVVKILFLRDLYVGLWSMLFLIPGIIKAYEYSMLPYLLAEDPTMDRKEAFHLSWEMTNGSKGAIFVLDLSFFGWMFLGTLLCGVGTFFVHPYVEATYVELFLALKAKVYYSRPRENTWSGDAQSEYPEYEYPQYETPEEDVRSENDPDNMM